MATVVVDEQAVRAAADAMSFEHGRAYFRDGRVRQIQVTGTEVTATVDGGSAYRVRLVVTAAGLDGECSCPRGAEGVFCKHCVATALAWLDSRGESAEPRPSSAGLRRFLLAQDVDWLVDELLRAAESDLSLRARLDVAAAADEGEAQDERSMRARLRSAIEIADYVDYEHAYAYFHDVNEAPTH